MPELELVKFQVGSADSVTTHRAPIAAHEQRLTACVHHGLFLID
jgi:hypothetical protein